MGVEAISASAASAELQPSLHGSWAALWYGIIGLPALHCGHGSLQLIHTNVQLRCGAKSEICNLTCATQMGVTLEVHRGWWLNSIVA